MIEVCYAFKDDGRCISLGFIGNIYLCRLHLNLDHAYVRIQLIYVYILHDLFNLFYVFFSI